MKLVLAISANLTPASERTRELVETVAELLHDGHRVAIVQGCAQDGLDTPSSRPYLVSRNADNRTVMNGAAASVADIAGAEATLLSAQLNAAQVHSLVLHGSDAGICKIRKKLWDKNNPTEVEVCAVESRWIETICTNGGVPIISNLLFTISGDYYAVDSCHLAAICAAGWNADLLTYLIEEEGIIDLDGAVVRWLEAEAIDRLSQNAENKALIARLKLSKEALQRGVRRVRLLPVSRVKCLPLFYFSRIEYGTEVIVSFTATRAEGALAAHGALGTFPLPNCNKHGGR